MSIYFIYHNSYTSAVQEAERMATEKYDVDQDQMAVDIGMNTRRPKDGETVRFHIDLYKDGKLQRKKLHAQVYGRGTKYSNFELNMYIS